MGVSLSATAAVIGVSILIIMQIFTTSIPLKVSQINDAYSEMKNRAVEQRQTDIDITNITDVGWWDTDWDYRKMIFIDHTKIQADQTDFPVLIYRENDLDLAVHAQPDGDDIVFVNDENNIKFSHELEKYNNTNGEMTSWVKIPALSANQDTIIYMYYGNLGCSNQQDISNTWDSNFKMVQHLNESSGTLYDSTSNNNDGANNGATYNTSSKIDGGYDFNGNDYVSCDDSSSLDITNQITLEGWVKDPPISKSNKQDDSVKIIDKRDERLQTVPGKKFTVERTVEGNSEVVFVALYSSSLRINDMILDDNSIFAGLYKAGVPKSEEEQNIENIRINLPEQLKDLGTIAYSKSFKLRDKEIIQMQFNIEKWCNLFSNERISYLIISSDENYDFECTTHVNTIIPYGQTISPLTITATNTTSVDNITLWYRYSSDNETWGPKTLGDINFGEYTGSLQFAGNGITYPESVKVTDNIVATVARIGGTYAGKLFTYWIDDDGTVNTTIIDSLKYERLWAYESEIIHLSGDVYLVIYRLEPDDCGKLMTVNITSDGQINGIIDRGGLDIYDWYPEVIHVYGTIYAIAYGGPGDDGWVQTYNITDEGIIQETPISTWEFDATNCFEPDIIQVGNSNYYAIVYRSDTSYGEIVTLEIANDGTITQSNIDSLVFTGLDTCIRPAIINTSGDGFAIMYESTGNDGWLSTINISSVDGDIEDTGVAESWEFDGILGQYGKIKQVYDDYYVMAFTGDGTDGWINTVQIIDGWDIGGGGSAVHSATDILEYDPIIAYENSLYHIKGQTWGISYRGTDYEWRIATFQIDNSGVMPAALNDSEIETAASSFNNNIIKMQDNLYVIAYQGVDDDGYFSSVHIDNLGAPTLIDQYEFDTLYCQYPDMMKITDNIFLIAYSGDGNDGYLRTYWIDDNGVINLTYLSEWEHDPSYGNYHCLEHVYGTVYAVAFSASGTDGWVKTFNVANDGTITASEIDHLEYDPTYGIYQDMTRMGTSNIFVIAYTNISTTGDGTLLTVEIQNDGTISNAPISELTYDAGTATMNYVMDISDTTGLLTYKDAAADGQLKSFSMNADGTNLAIVETWTYDLDMDWPKLRNITTGMYAIFFVGAGDDGWMGTVEVDPSNGDITSSFHDTYEFDKEYAFDPSIVYIGEGVWGIAYRSLFSDGTLLTLKIKEDGQVRKGVDNIDNPSYEATLCQVTDGIYAIAYRGIDNDGYLKTFQVKDNDGFINQTMVDTLEFEDAETCAFPSLIKINNNLVAVAYTADASDGWVKTISINDDGSILGVIDSLEFSLTATQIRLVYIQGDIYATTYTGAGNDPYLCTFSINSGTGDISAKIEERTFDTNGINPHMTHLLGDVCVYVYSGVGSDGWMRTFNISSTGDISNSAIDFLEFDELQCTYPYIQKLDDNSVAVFYSGTGGDFDIITTNISADGQIEAATQNDVTDRATGIVGLIAYNDVISLGGEYYAVTYQATGSDGYTTTIKITDDGNIDRPTYKSDELFLANGLNPEIEYLFGNYYVIARQADLNMIDLAVVKLNTQMGIGWTEYEIDESYPFSWSFNFPNGTGYYEFYSIGKKVGFLDEFAPNVADAICYYLITNTPPVLTNETPKNASTNIDLDPILSIQVNDSEGHKMNITWYWGTDSSCPDFIGTNSSVNNGTYNANNDNNFSSYNKTYYWRVIVNDEYGGWTNKTYHFTTFNAKEIINKGRDAYSLEIGLSGTTLYGYVNGNSVQTSIDTNWHYVTLTYDGSQLRIYKDGKFEANTSMTGNINTNANDLLLGRYLTGTLDEVRISSTARSAAWINTTHEMTISPTSFIEVEPEQNQQHTYLNITIENTGSTTIKTQDCTLLINGTKTSFVCIQTCFYPLKETNIFANVTVVGSKRNKFITGNGIIDYEGYG